MDNKHNKFITGALVGLGLGLLFAPIDSSGARKELKSSLNKLLESVKEIDIEKTKSAFMKRLSEIKDELCDLDDKTRRDLVKIKINKIKETCLELEQIAKDYKSIKVEEAAKEVELRADMMLDELDQKELEVVTKKKTPSKKTTSKKTSVKKKTKRKK